MKTLANGLSHLLFGATLAALSSVSAEARAQDMATGGAAATATVSASVEAPPSRKWSGTLDAAATYGIGGYSALGVQLHGVAQRNIWNTRLAAGTLDVGGVFGWQTEPMFLKYDQATGLDSDTRRINAWATVGTSVHLGRERRATLGVHVFGGWTHLWSSAELRRPELGIDRMVGDNYGKLNAGAMVKFDYRVSRHLGLNLQVVGPFPIQPSYVTTLFHVGVGITTYF